MQKKLLDAAGKAEEAAKSLREVEKQLVSEWEKRGEGFRGDDRGAALKDGLSISRTCADHLERAAEALRREAEEVVSRMKLSVKDDSGTPAPTSSAPSPSSGAEKIIGG